MHTRHTFFAVLNSKGAAPSRIARGREFADDTVEGEEEGKASYAATVRSRSRAAQGTLIKHTPTVYYIAFASSVIVSLSAYRALCKLLHQSSDPAEPFRSAETRPVSRSARSSVPN